MATILVMDDEAPIRTLLRTALESVGHKVMEAANGHDGLALYRQTPADLVIADILMPEMNGRNTLIELMQEFLDVKVIAVSGAAEDQRMWIWPDYWAHVRPYTSQLGYKNGSTL